ncbi:hypothetical protein DY000_02002248 [Brassica cretica]|uniref:Uncharacterized protein n=1 Tax=Brassica cretica TaxID=69181 RepID=A0ABQ7BYK5_BRACR|nr:hypothetical protein DY000_02002248 [Brassica cretica]
MAIRWRFSPSLWLSSTERRELYWWSSATKENRDLSIGGSSRPWETARKGVLIKTHHTCSSHKGPTILHRGKTYLFALFKALYSLVDGGDSKSSQATENKRPPGVNAAKKSSQKTVVSDDNLNKLQSETVPLSEADNESSRVRAVERGHEM